MNTPRRPRLPSFSLSQAGLFLGPLIAVLVWALLGESAAFPRARPMAAIAALMATLWLTEAIPLAATALLPLVLFPLFGVESGKTIAPAYCNDVIFLFLGGFLVALSMQRTDLHRRIAVRLLLALGTAPRRILLGFAVTSAFLSMWISNSATTMILVPIALSIGRRLEAQTEGQAAARFSIGLLLAVAYGASIGGFSTLVGTPPNLAFLRTFAIQFPEGPEISFARWLLFAWPLSLLMLAVTFALLAWRYAPKGLVLASERGALIADLKALGPLHRSERAVLWIFLALVFAWIFRQDLELPGLRIPGWSRLLNHGGFLDDGTVAMLAALLLFLVPFRTKTGERILEAKSFRELPYDMILLFGGGFALASGFQSSGLSALIGEGLTGLRGLPPWLIVLTICATLTFLTELTSNLASAQMILPILAAMAVALGLDPLLLMIPATLACSLAFMLPAATPPNAIAFGSGVLPLREMTRTGLILNVLAIALLFGWVLLAGESLLGIDFEGQPAWARPR